MKNQMKKICTLLLVFTMAISFAVPSMAATKKVNITMPYLSSQTSRTIGRYHSLKKRIGKMTKKKNASYRNFYATGNKMTLGVNYDPTGKRTKHYVYIKNSGNKNVGILNVYPGTSSKTVKSRMRDNHLYYYGGKYWYGDAGYVKFTYKSGKVSGFVYYCTPSDY